MAIGRVRIHPILPIHKDIKERVISRVEREIVSHSKGGPNHQNTIAMRRLSGLLASK